MASQVTDFSFWNEMWKQSYYNREKGIRANPLLEYWDNPDRLHKALMNSSHVISAWDGDRLVGLIRVMDDSELVCFINYVLVHPDYHGCGIAGHLLEMVKEAYKSYLYINVMIGDSKNASFYEKHGFKIKEDSLPMQYRNVPKYTKR